MTQDADSGTTDPADRPEQHAAAGDTPDTTARYQIGEVAQMTGVTQRTLRFYEEKGLLEPTDRMEGGFRLYSDADVEHIQNIRRMQELLGFTLAEIKEMVDADEVRAQIRASFRPDRDAGGRLERIEAARTAVRRQLEVVEPKLSQLGALRDDLRARLAALDERERELTGAAEGGANRGGDAEA